MVSPVQKLAKSLDVTISDATSITSAINLVGRILVGIHIPASWTAASITFQASDTEAGTYVDVYDTDNAELTLSAAASSRYLAIDPVNLLGVNFLKVRSGTSAAAVNQTGDITLQLMLATPDVS